MLTRIASRENYIPSKKSLFENFSKIQTAKLPLRRCISENTSLIENKRKPTNSKLKRHSTSSDLDENLFKIKVKCLAPSTEISRRDKSLGLLCERLVNLLLVDSVFS